MSMNIMFHVILQEIKEAWLKLTECPDMQTKTGYF